MRTAAAVHPHSRFDVLRALMLLIDLGIVAYVCFGWNATSRLALFFYVMLLPLIMMQWLFNRGASMISNFESRIRSGHWRDPSNPFEGHLFQTLFRAVGIRFTQVQIGTLLVLTMSLLWIVAMFRMVVAA